MDLGRSLRFLSAAAAAFGFTLLGAGAVQAQDVSIQINGQTVGINPPPILQAGRVFVPLRGVFEQLGATVVYSNGEINATGNGSEISLHIGSTQATVNGQPQTVDVAPFIIGASTYVPLRFVSQALGAGVEWDAVDHVVQISTSGVPPQGGQQAPPPGYDQGAPSYADATDWVDQAPPPIPAYDPPPAPDTNYIWMPGYWAWGPYGFYWVPGTWVPAPQPGLLWTPGYWGYQDGYYGWHAGYWAPTVGFYGGVYYGGGYYGNGFVGGRWSGHIYRYNTAVVRVAPTIVNVYVDRNVIVNAPHSRSSYSGGPGGMRATLTASERATARAPHVGLTPVQQQHIRVASQDRHLLAAANGGKPPVVTATQPFTPARRPTGFTPVTTQDKNAAQKLIVHPTFARPPNAVAPREVPGTTPRPAVHTAPPAVRTAPPAVRTPAPLTRTAPPVVRTRPPERPAGVSAPLRTAPPAMRTPPPVLRTPAQIVRTPPPVVRTPPPVMRTPAAVVRTPAPVMRTPAPVVRTPAPVVRTPAPERPASQTAPERTAPAMPRPSGPHGAAAPPTDAQTTADGNAVMSGAKV